MRDTRNDTPAMGDVFPPALFMVGLLLSAVVAWSQYESIEKEARAEFDRMAVRADAEITNRIGKVELPLRGARGLYAANPLVKRAEFRRFILSRDIPREFPGVRGFGFIQWVDLTEVDAFVAAEQADDAPDFAIRQLADKSHPELFVIKFIEPAANNLGALGLDVGSESVRRTGLQQAVVTGAPTITGVITLVQDNKKSPGVLIYLPVFRSGAPTTNPAERQAALLGVLYAPIVMADILDGIPDVKSGKLDFEIYDSPLATPGGLLMFDATPGANGRFALRKSLDLPGRSVTLQINSTPAFDASISVVLPWLVFLGGGLVSALLAVMLHQQARGRRYAEKLAAGMTRDLSSALRDNEALLSTLNLYSIVSVTDRGGRIIEANDAFCHISGYSRDELIGQDHRIVNSAVQPVAFWVDMWKTISSGMPWRGQVCNLSKNGDLYWVDTLIAPFIGSDGQIEKYTSIRTDITASKKNELELIDATEAAQAASLSKSQFLANMSHEIRTPMNAILGMLTLLRKTDLTTRQSDYAAKSQGAARALLGLLNEILDFSKIEAGKMELDPHPFTVDQLLRDLSVILSANVGDKPVEVLFDIDPTLPRQLVGDAMRLQQILLNLGSNAIKFTQQGEVVLALKILIRTDDVVTVQFSMRDSGIGIAPENQARIFSGFTQAESSTTRRFGGTGLGVAISQRFVGLMGGELELQSALGQGSRFFFTITLPISAQCDEEERQRMRERAENASWRTLVIDDNPIAREVLEHMGQSLGWQVDLAESGEQALEMLRHSAAQDIHYQAIFVDWSMPGMDGWQTTQHIREIQADKLQSGDTHKAPVVVMVTAHGREMLIQRSPQEQALLDGYLVKPITASMLFDAVIDARDGNNQPHPSHEVSETSLRRLDGMRLLVAEDNLNNQQVVRELLEDEGALVVIANHGQEAVEAIAATEPPFDVVLMDLQMPVMDGFAATKVIRNDLKLTTLPIVAMTANAMASDREACLAVGMNDHVGKPFDLNDLVRVLRRHAQWEEAAAPAPVELPLSLEVVQAAAWAGLDLTAALHRLGRKQDVYVRMLKTFVKDLHAMPEQLQSATPDDAKRVLHTLKGLAATLGASALSTEAALAEKALASSPTPEQVQHTTERACQAISTALPGLQDVLTAMQVALAAAKEGADAPTLNRPALAAALQALAQLLEADDMESMTAMALLTQQFGEQLAEELAPLEQAMSDMEFAAALPLCNTLLERYAG